MNDKPNPALADLIPDSAPVPAHFTASAVIIHRGHILLIHHRRIGAWLPPGGHLDEGEMPDETCLREAQEETGVACELVREGFAEIPQTGDPEAYILPPPLCIHHVLAFENGAPVVHIDLAYLCRPRLAGAGDALADLNASDEVYGARWVPLDSLGTLKLAKNVTEIVRMAVDKLALQ